MTSHPSDRPVSALRARMIEDMRVRGFSEKTSNDYIRNVRAFAAFIRRSPDTATAEDLRRFQHHQAQTGVRPPSINSAVAALRFFFTVTLDRPDLARRLTVVREPRRLSAVLSVEEVTQLLQAAPGPRRHSPPPMALGCASPRSLRSRSATSIPSACCCGSSRARAARTATACYRRSCSRCCAPGGGRVGVWGCCRGAGCFPAAIRSSRSRPASSIAPSTLRPKPPASRNACRRTRCGTASPRICWNRTLTSASSRACPGESRGAARPCQARHHGPLHPRRQ